MTIAADNDCSPSSVERFYQDYIEHTEHLREAIHRREWGNIERYVSWREEKLREMNALPVDSDTIEDVHKEYLNRIMALELANINSLNEVMESLKVSIRENGDTALGSTYAGIA